MATKKATLNCWRCLLEAWEEELGRHDLALPTLSKMPGYSILEKSFKNRRKRILWNITHLKNLIHTYEQPKRLLGSTC